MRQVIIHLIFPAFLCFKEVFHAFLLGNLFDDKEFKVFDLAKWVQRI
jgi:hypothetical protein